MGEREVRELNGNGKNTIKINKMNKKTPRVHGLENNTVEMTVLSKVVYRFSAIPIKIQMSFLKEIEKPY